MPAPAVTPAASKAAAALARTAPTPLPPRRGDDDFGSGGGLAVLVLVCVGLALGVVLLASLLGGTAQRSCSVAGGQVPGDFGGPGSLGGVGGTGVSRPLVERLRAGSPYAGPRVTPGAYVSTAYGPPWGGIQGMGIATSGGLPISGGAPRWYMLAADP